MIKLAQSDLVDFDKVRYIKASCWAKKHIFKFKYRKITKLLVYFILPITKSPANAQ